LAIEPRLVVTGLADDGTGEQVLSDRPATPVSVRAFPGQELYLLWGTEDGGATVGTKSPQPKVLPFFPGTGGTRLLFVRFPPESSIQQPAGDAAELAAEVSEKLPGLVDVFDPDQPGMHATDTLDYGICLEGELWLELDQGKEVRLTPGTCVVQNGTRHAWRNHGDVPALMCFVGIGAKRDSS
jgi:mannose-6-phosphate isomerase-like protein (cupin superfamily)